MGKKRRAARSRRAAAPLAAAPEAPSAAPAARLPRSWLAAVAGLAFLVRAAAAVQLGRTALFRFPQLDSLEFLLWAQSIARGEARWPAVPTHGPGYPYFLGALLALFDGSFAAVRLVQAALGAALCVFAALLAARLFDDRRAGLAAGLLLALYGPLVYVEVSLLAEGLLTVLLIAALWCLLRPGATPAASVAAAAAAGLCVGLAAVTRATALALVPALALVLLLDRRRPRRALAAGAFAAAALAVVLPVLVAVRQASGSWLPIQGYGGLNLYMGNRPGAPGVPTARLGGAWDLLSGEAARRGVAGAAAQERWYTRRLLAEARERPGAVLAAVGRKAVWLLQDEEIRESHSFYFFRERSALLRFLPGFALLFPLALCGLVAAIRGRRLPPALAVYLLVFAASCVAIVVSSRYRLPLVPALAVLAGGGIAWIIDAARARRWKTLGGLAALLAAGFAATQLRDHAPSRNLAEEWAATAMSLEARDDLAGARAAVDSALAADPDSALAWAVAGRLAEREGDAARAERAFAASARLAPDFQRARLNLGAALRRRGDLAGAERELRRALWLVPGHPAAQRELAAVLVERARRAGAARDPARGQTLAAEAARLAPGEAEAWLTLALLALDAGDRAAARAALERASGMLGPEAPPVALGWALLERLEGRPEAAAERLQRLLLRHPGYQPAAQLLRALAGESGRRPA
ncbi:MAG TPA: glycosyltransferase family 39 protein [Thermoanaerobaculia bacterium]